MAQEYNSFLCARPSGALLKAAFICAGIVHLHSELPLREQLLHSFNGGFELHTWSELPHGSGLGKPWFQGPSLPQLILACGPGPWPPCSTTSGWDWWDWTEVSGDWCLPLCSAGTSSILAGAALAALQRAAGRAVGTEALIHAVLHLEQVLTTGTQWCRVVVNS